MISLDKLKQNDSGIIVKINSTFKVRNKFSHLGIVLGEYITMIKNNPLNSLIEILVLDTKLAISVKDAKHIFVEQDNLRK